MSHRARKRTGSGGGLSMAEYDAFCAGLPAATTVVQWGGAHVWKVGGKVFAIAWDDETPGHEPLITFKCSDLSFDMLKDLPGVRPAPYLASRGLKWIQRTGNETLDGDGVRTYLAESHRIVAKGLTRRKRAELGLAASPPLSEHDPKFQRAQGARASRGGNP